VVIDSLFCRQIEHRYGYSYVSSAFHEQSSGEIAREDLDRSIGVVHFSSFGMFCPRHFCCYRYTDSSVTHTTELREDAQRNQRLRSQYLQYNRCEAFRGKQRDFSGAIEIECGVTADRKPNYADSHFAKSKLDSNEHTGRFYECQCRNPISAEFDKDRATGGRSYRGDIGLLIAAAGFEQSEADDFGRSVAKIRKPSLGTGTGSGRRLLRRADGVYRHGSAEGKGCRIEFPRSLVGKLPHVRAHVFGVAVRAIGYLLVEQPTFMTNVG
jgi:hypothetical protein